MSASRVISRRRFLASGCASLALAAGLGGCGQHGPERINWGHDTCTTCAAEIVDPRFAAQVGGPHDQMWKFDDIGCAMVFLSKQPWGDDPAAQIWVGNSTLGGGGGAAWLDARASGFVAGIASPRHYDYGAVPRPIAGAQDYKTFRAALLEKLAG